MNTPTKTLLTALALSAASHAATVALVTNTNSSEVTGGGTDFVAELQSGQTLFVAIPYAAGAWPTAEAIDYFEVKSFMLSAGGASTVSFSFYSATDTGTALSNISQLDNITAGSSNVAAAVNGAPPADPGNTSVAEVTAQIQYANLTGNPFSSISNGILWLGITNTGANTVSYYTGTPLGFGTPAPTYSFGDPLDTGAGSLLEDTYIYNGGTFVSGSQNVHPYININAVTVPEPRCAMLGAFGVLALLRRRRAA